MTFFSLTKLFYMNDGDLLNLIVTEVDQSVDNIFVLVHSEVSSASGDITPEQNEELISIKENLSNLIFNQVKQNL